MKLSVQILLAFGVITILSITDSYFNYLLSKKVERNSKFLSKSEAIIRNSNRTHKVIIDMQSSFRGYLLTDDTTFLDSYYEGVESVPVYLEEQRKLIDTDRPQRDLLDSVTAIHMRWVAYSGKLIESRRSAQPMYNLLFERTLKRQVGKKLNDDIARKFARFDKLEYATRRQHRASLNQSIQNTHVFSVIFLTLTVVVGAFSTVYIVVLITRRIASMVKLAEGIARGQFAVVTDTRKDELAGLSVSLNRMSFNLDQTIRELKNRNTELNKFAYVVSHDLKAPLRGIHNVITWIEEDLTQEISAKMRDYLKIIRERSSRMEALINGLLDYARVNHKTAPELVDTHELVHEIADSLVPRTFELHVDQLPEIYTERLKLEQVFANLISNAVKYTPHPQGRISITCKEFPEYFEFSVKDNGVGIDSAYHEKIFEIFQTLRERNAKESTGIGLAIVKKIIDEYQEHIYVESPPEGGTTFIFTWKK
jgi:signal transduction histidine kinase